MSRLLIVIFVAMLTISSAPAIKPKYKESAAPIEQRVHDLLSRMTLKDKCNQLNIWHINTLELNNHEVFKRSLEQLGDTIRDGVGFVQFDTKMAHRKYATSFNTYQKYLVDSTRLGIPAISNGEGCHGFVGNEGYSTVFPVPLSIGSTWDTLLTREIYTAVAKQMRSYGITHAASPVIDLLRDARFGRSDEMLGEDPYHVAHMGVAAILGFQGDSPTIDSNHLLACAKHFAGHGQPEGGTNLAPVNISERLLRENHFYPFELAVKRANVRSVMASYNEIDGVPNHANSWLLNDVLRGEWGFTGYVISDYDAVNRMFTRQRAASSRDDAALRSIASGMDFECPKSRSEYCFAAIPALIASGKLKESVLDSAVVRVLRNKFILGLFENPYVVLEDTLTIAARAKKGAELALRAAESGIVLLKNSNHTLPFDPQSIGSIAIIGPNADEVHYGSYSNEMTRGVSIVEGITRYASGRFNVGYAEGFKIYENDNSIAPEDKTPRAEQQRIDEAVELARRSDVVLLVMGGNELTCREEWKEHSGDRVDLELLGRQNDLAQAIFALKKPTAVLLINGRPLSVSYLAQAAPALMEGWYLGQEQGRAVARTIFGDVSPSGRLSVTIPRSVGQLPVFYNSKPYVHESPFISGEYSPLYPFGFGLSYTTFAFANLRVSSDKIKIGESLKVTIDVTNTGARDAQHVVQLYIRDEVSTVTRPRKELKDFAKITIKKGETRSVTFVVTPDKFQYFGVGMKRIIEAGEFEIQVGSSSEEYLSRKIVLTE